jgi:carbon monoxide dehydrogenase subunit G
MELEHSFTVPVPRDRAWDVLLDVERVAPCMPGATLDSVDGDEIHGRIKVKVGPINMTYAGTARFVEKDKTSGVVRLEASGKETRGAGTASATVRSVLEDRGDQTAVVVLTTLNVTGRPAQFGRGVMNEVGGKLLTIFATNLAATLAQEGAAASGQPAADAPIDELKLPARATSSLHREGISTIGQLASKTEDELLAIDGIGPASVEEIKTKLTDLGLTPGQPLPAAAVAPPPVAATQPTGGATPSAPSATSATEAASAPSAPDGAAAAVVPHHSAAREVAHQLEDDALNLLKVAGLPVLKRAIPVLAGVAAALLIALRRKARRRNR